MNDAMRERATKLEQQFNSGTMSQKAVIKTILALSVIVDSKLDKAVKVDAIMSSVEMLASVIRVDTLITVKDCEKETGAPFGLIIGTMGLEARERAQKHERRSNTIMQLFIDEMEKRDG